MLRDMAGDYVEAQNYIVDRLEKYKVSQTMISETWLVFEALCYKIFEQRENAQNELTVSVFRRMGDLALEINYNGLRFDPEPQNPAEITPEDSILRSYGDKIDYSYQAGRNRITITTKRNHMASLGMYAASFALGIAAYALLRYTATEEVQKLVADKLIFPLEQLFVNAILMVGAPVTFLSMLKHLTDTYILAGSTSHLRRLHRTTIVSSLVSMLLAVAVGLLLTKLLFSHTPMSGKYPRGTINMDPARLIPSFLPTDIFAPFQTVMPYSLIILAILTTYAFCSVGKYFDRMKDTIDAAYVLFARMLSLIMYVLPAFAFCSIMDELFSEGFTSLLYLAEMLAVAFASLLVLIGYFLLRLLVKGIRPLPFMRKMLPLLHENARIASAFDAVPYNVRYCARVYGFDRKRLEQSLPILTQVNLDGNCFLVTLIAMLYIAINSTALTAEYAIAVGFLVLLLSLGAPNQPGSCIVSLTIVMLFLQANDLTTIALIGEAVFGGVLNLTNIAGDLVLVAGEEVQEQGSAEKLNKMLG